MSEKLDKNNQERPDAEERAKKRGNDALFRTMTHDEWERLQTILNKHDAQSMDNVEAVSSPSQSQQESPSHSDFSAEQAPHAYSVSAASAPSLPSSNEFSPSQIGAPPPLQKGSILKGSYRLIKQLSVGKLGTVYAVDHIRFGGRYAIKVLHPHLAQAPQQLQVILRAIRGAERMNHPGIVRPFLLDQDEASQAIFYFMDFVAGHSLAGALANRTGQEESPPFSAQSLLEFVEALVEPLRYAHSRDLVCRNLHPAHVLKTTDDDAPVRLLNFGFPIQVAQTSSQMLSSETLNDLYYAAPELRSPGQPVTAATDIFSMGVLLYQMLTGILPVGVAQPPSRIFGVWPPSVDAVVGKATQANWEDRYQSVDDFLESLRKALRGRVATASSQGPHHLASRSLENNPGVATINRFQSVVSPAAGGPSRLPRPSREELPRIQSQRPRQPSFEETRAVGRMPSPHPGMPPRQGRAPSMHPPSTPTGRLPSFHPPSGPRNPAGRTGERPTTGRPRHPSSGERPTTGRHPRGRPTGERQAVAPWGSPLRGPSTPLPSAVPELRGLPPTKPSTTWNAHEKRITSVALSPDGKFLATAGQDNTFKVWAAGSWSLLHNVPVDAFRINHLKWSHNSRYIAFANEDDQIEVWDLQNQQRVHVFSPNARVMGIAWNPNGHHLYAATDDGHISIWHLALGRQSGSLLGHRDAVNALLYVPGQEWLISGGEDPSIRLWNVANKQLQKALCQSPTPTYAMALSPQADRLATGHSDGSILLHSFPQGKHQAALKGHEGALRSLSFSPKGTWLASASHDGHIILWDATQHTQIADLAHHSGPVHSIDIHATGRWMVSASNDTELCIWDVSRL